jgi:hypothetical protein
VAHGLILSRCYVETRLGRWIAEPVNPRAGSNFGFNKVKTVDATRSDVRARTKNLPRIQINRSRSTCRARESSEETSASISFPASDWGSISLFGFTAVCVTSPLLSLEAYLGHDFG